MRSELVLLDNPRRRRRRHNPEGLVEDSLDLAKIGLGVGAGYGAATWVSRFFPAAVKNNAWLSAGAKVLAGLATMSARRWIPGGKAVVDSLAAGMAANGVVEVVSKQFGAMPGASYLPRAAGGGGRLPVYRQTPNLPMVPAVPAATIAERVAPIRSSTVIR